MSAQLSMNQQLPNAGRLALCEISLQTRLLARLIPAMQCVM